MADGGYPYGHNPHHHHHHRDDDYPPPPPNAYPPPPQHPYEAYPPPPRPAYGEPYPPNPYPPPPQEYGYDRPRPHEYNPYPPPPPAVQHVSHDTRPPPHHDHAPFGADVPTVKICCKAGQGLCLAVRDGVVCLVHENPRDDRQHWIKDLKYSTRVKDEEGYPAFSLINKGTGEALKHAVGQEHPVRLVRYNPDYLDESVLWTESKDVGHGFRCIRMVNNIYLNFDAYHGDKDHGGVHDGTTLTVWKWCEGDNQRWKIIPW